MPQDVFPFFVIVPLIGFYLIKPKMFEWLWIGHAALVYAAFFVILTWLHYRVIHRGKKADTNVTWLGAIAFFFGIYFYHLLLYGDVLPQYILQAGTTLGISGWWLSVGWTVSVDFIVFTLYIIGVIMSFFGVKSLRHFLAPIVYSVILICAFLINALSGPASRQFAVFQWWVPGIVFLVANLLQMLGVNVTYSGDVLITPKARIIVGWPCAGIHSLLIYTAVAYSFLQNLNVSRRRKAIYLILGLIGTYVVNILRIAAIIFGNHYFDWSLYTMHMYTGELFFIAWIIIFLFVVVMIERRRGRTRETSSTK